MQFSSLLSLPKSETFRKKIKEEKEWTFSNKSLLTRNLQQSKFHSHYYFLEQKSLNNKLIKRIFYIYSNLLKSQKIENSFKLNNATKKIDKNYPLKRQLEIKINLIRYFNLQSANLEFNRVDLKINKYFLRLINMQNSKAKTIKKKIDQKRKNNFSLLRIMPFKTKYVCKGLTYSAFFSPVFNNNFFSKKILLLIPNTEMVQSSKNHQLILTKQEISQQFLLKKSQKKFTSNQSFFSSVFFLGTPGQKKKLLEAVQTEAINSLNVPQNSYYESLFLFETLLKKWTLNKKFSKSFKLKKFNRPSTLRYMLKYLEMQKTKVNFLVCGDLKKQAKFDQFKRSLNVFCQQNRTKLNSINNNWLLKLNKFWNPVYRSFPLISTAETRNSNQLSFLFSPVTSSLSLAKQKQQTQNFDKQKEDRYSFIKIKKENNKIKTKKLDLTEKNKISNKLFNELLILRNLLSYSPSFFWYKKKWKTPKSLAFQKNKPTCWQKKKKVIIEKFKKIMNYTYYQSKSVVLKKLLISETYKKISNCPSLVFRDQKKSLDFSSLKAMISLCNSPYLESKQLFKINKDKRNTNSLAKNKITKNKVLNFVKNLTKLENNFLGSNKSESNSYFFCTKKKQLLKNSQKFNFPFMKIIRERNLFSKDKMDFFSLYPKKTEGFKENNNLKIIKLQYSIIKAPQAFSIFFCTKKKGTLFL